MCVTIGVDSCAGFICNYHNLPYQLNLPIAAIEMTAYVYDPCVRNDQYGQWANVWYELVLVHMPIIPTPPTNPWHNKIRIEDVRQFLGGNIPAEVDGSISQP